MWPLASKMTPEPWPPPWPLVTVIATTLGETVAAVTDQLGVVALPPTWAGDVVGPALIWARGDEATSVRVTAYVPALARTAATTAIAPISASLRGLPD
jgi:hypothetical protein